MPVSHRLRSMPGNLARRVKGNGSNWRSAAFHGLCPVAPGSLRRKRYGLYRVLLGGASNPQAGTAGFLLPFAKPWLPRVELDGANNDKKHHQGGEDDTGEVEHGSILFARIMGDKGLRRGNRACRPIQAQPRLRHVFSMSEGKKASTPVP